jgi:mycothiol synthase
VRIEGVLHPDYRDDAIGADLVAWFVRAGKLVHERTFPGAPPEQYGHAHESQHRYSGVLETGGFHVARSFVDMRVDLGELPPAQLLPEGFRLAPFEQKYDELTRTSVRTSAWALWRSTAFLPGS